ncbi:hypothetical protein HGRIS_010685 [Hohenbuehelia grisea]|uniref:Uncharacterized protein n=1 Tax=Hohenbuehelia grisea TaxID=104357 RepID=A0ABR3IXG4_9AGAR
MASPVTIFWPLDLTVSGFCFGWLSSSICIAGTLDASSIEEARKLLSTRISLYSKFEQSTSGAPAPTILGSCSFNITIRKGHHPKPVLDFLQPQRHIFIYYSRHGPRSLRFHSLHGLKLDFGLHQRAEAPRQPFLDADFTRRDASLSKSDLMDTLDQFNVAKLLEEVLHRQPKPPIPLWSRLISPFSPIFSVLSRTALTASYTVSGICNTRVLFIPSLPALKDVSATVQQLDVRTEQIEFFDHQVRKLTSAQSPSLPIYVAHYVNFFNTVWLVLNDVTIGFAFGSFLCENDVYLANHVKLVIDVVFVGWTQWALGWLNSWPAGLKLNTELSQFYVDTFVNLISIWGRLLHIISPYLPHIIYGIGIISCGGMTMGLSLFSDLLSVLTTHLYICYLLSTAVYHRSLLTAASLWNLFRGKRYNVLRKRVDSWEYDVDQLLFGTMLFTLLAFLFPTIIAYYLLFAMIRLLVILLHAAIETQIAFMNHFPLFALTLRFKDPWRLPGGIYLSFESSSHTLQPIVIVKNQPLSFAAIFYQYIPLWNRLASHYNPLRLIGCLVKGGYLASIPRYSIRYSKIPESVEVVKDE